MDKKLYHIAFGINNNHSKYIRVVINSIAVNNKNIDFYLHIINDGLSNSNKKKLNNEIYNHPNLRIKYYNIDAKIFEGLVTREWHVSTWYRILLPQLLDKDIKKILYLDSDTLVNGNLEELFKIDLKDYSLAAVPNVLYLKESYLKRLSMNKSENYICAGVMLINLEYWRQNDITEKIFSFANNYSRLLVCPDQDAINVVNDGKIKLLPFEYGYLLDFPGKQQSIIFHYGYLKPWKFTKNCPYFNIWKKYNNNLLNPINLYIPNLIVYLKAFIYKLNTLIGLRNLILK